jgi:hypothetical protein
MTAVAATATMMMITADMGAEIMKINAVILSKMWVTR